MFSLMLAIAMLVKLSQMEQKGAGPGARSSHAITLVGHTAYSFGGEFTPRVPVDSTMYAFDLSMCVAVQSAGLVCFL